MYIWGDIQKETDPHTRVLMVQIDDWKIIQVGTTQKLDDWPQIRKCRLFYS